MRCVQVLAKIRLNVASVEQFLAIGQSLADDEPQIRPKVEEAVREARAAALLIDHLRNLFSHQHSIEDALAQQQQHHQPHHQQHQLGPNSLLFTYSNQATLVRAAKSLVANVAKILYLTDFLARSPTSSDALDRREGQLQQQNESFLDTLAQEFGRAESGPPSRLDNVANYSQLLRCFGELAGELVDLGHCVLAARCATPPGPGQRFRPTRALNSNNGAQADRDYGAATATTMTTPDDEACDGDGGSGDGEWWQRAASLEDTSGRLEAHIQDALTLFQVNRLTIDRSILLLLSASKCCLRPPSAECLPALEAARANIGGQIRASISIIMAIVKWSIFGEAASATVTTTAGGGLAGEANKRVCGPTAAAAAATALRDNQFDYNKPTAACQSVAPPHQLGAQTSSSAAAPLGAQANLQIINYFLESWTGTRSAHEAINKLQLLVAPLARTSDLASLARSLDAMFEQQRLAQHPLDQQQPPSDNSATDKENLAAPFALMNRRQLVGALNRLFLGELRQQLVERVHEFTDCAYTRHEHRETIVQLLQCLKLQLNKLVKLIYRLRRKTRATPGQADGGGPEPVALGQLRQLAAHLDDTCNELKFELQSVVIEQSDELDRSHAQLDLVKQLKQASLRGDETRTGEAARLFREQTEQLIEACAMLNQVAPTHKMRITTKSLAIWFQLNTWPPQLLQLLHWLAANPRSRHLKDFAWAYLQVWCSFYDDFCQLARQLAYLCHAHYDPQRARRVQLIREQVAARRARHPRRPSSSMAGATNLEQLGVAADGVDELGDDDDDYELVGLTLEAAAANSSPSPIAAASSLSPHRRPLNRWPPQEGSHLYTAAVTGQPPSYLAQTTSVQSLTGQLSQLEETSRELQGEPTTDSPRSLDHYHGFGHNYRRHHHHHHRPHQHHHRLEADKEEFQEDQDDELLASVSLSPSSPQSPPLPLHLPQAGGRHSQAFVSADTFAYTLRPQQQQQQPQQHLHWAPPTLHRPPRPPPLQLQARPAHPAQPAASFAGQRRAVTIDAGGPTVLNTRPSLYPRQEHEEAEGACSWPPSMASNPQPPPPPPSAPPAASEESDAVDAANASGGINGNSGANSGATSEPDSAKWSDSEADAIVRGAKETAQMAMSMYQFTKGEGDLNTTQDLFTQAELFAEEANELYKEVRCFSYKVPAGELKRQLLQQLATIPALVQQLQFIVKNPTVGKPATFAKVDSVIRETRQLMEAVNRVVTATLACRQHYNMAIASMRKRTRTLSPSYRNDTGSFEFDQLGSSGRQAGALGGRGGAGPGGGGNMGSEPDI